MESELLLLQVAAPDPEDALSRWPALGWHSFLLLVTESGQRATSLREVSCANKKPELVALAQIQFLSQFGVVTVQEVEKLLEFCTNESESDDAASREEETYGWCSRVLLLGQDAGLGAPVTLRFFWLCAVAHPTW